jgi:hypothetical protein
VDGGGGIIAADKGDLGKGESDRALENGKWACAEM